MKKVFSFLMAICLVFTVVSANLTFNASAADVIKIACVGDSITQGASDYNYPMYLQELLGEKYAVSNRTKHLFTRL